MSTLVEISLGASLLIAVLLLTAPLLSKRYSAKWRYWVWLILAVRLLLPFNISLPAAPITLSASSQNISFQLPVMEKPQTIVEVPISPKQITAGTTAAPQTQSADTTAKTFPLSLPSLTTVLFMLWLMGAASFLLYHLIGYALFWKSVRRYSRAADTETITQFLEIKSNLYIQKDIKLILHPKLSTPMMAGFFHPSLLLPSGIHPDDLSVILTHELIHYKRRDLWYKAILLLTQSVHWFNPLVHLMARAACRDIETSCDEQILRGSDLDARRRYGETLLRTIRRDTFRETSLCTNFYGGKHSMKQRFLQLFDLSKKKTGLLLFAVILATALLAGALISCSRSAKQDDFINEAEEIEVLQDYVFHLKENNAKSIHFSSSKSTPYTVKGVYRAEQFALFDDTAYRFQVTDNTFTFGENNTGVINGVNTLLDNRLIHSLPLKGFPIQTEDFTFNTLPVSYYMTSLSTKTKVEIEARTFSGKVYLSVVNKDGARMYQYTYSLSDGKNDIMISFYAPDKNRKILYDTIVSSIRITGTVTNNYKQPVVKGNKNSNDLMNHRYITPDGYINFSTPLKWDYDSGARITYEAFTTETETGVYTRRGSNYNNSSIRDGEFDYDEYLYNGQKIAKFAYLSADEPVSTYELEGSIISETELTVGKASSKELTALQKGNVNAQFKEITGTLTITDLPGSPNSYQYTYAFPIGADTFLIQFYTTEKDKPKNLKAFENLLSKVRYVQTSN